MVYCSHGNQTCDTKKGSAISVWPWYPTSARVSRSGVECQGVDPQVLLLGVSQPGALSVCDVRQEKKNTPKMCLMNEL